MFNREYFEKQTIVKDIIGFEKRLESDKAKSKIHVCFNIDVSFFMPAGVTITSMLENNPEIDFDFYIFTDAVTEKDLLALEKTAAKYEQNCYVYVMDMEPFNNFHIKHPRFKRVSYFRLYMPKILKERTRCFLYVDADLMCINSMKPFLSIDLEGKSLGAVADLPEAAKSRSEFLKLKNGKYLNSGVLWIDTVQWEKEYITEKAFAYQGKNPNMFTCHDQDVLNLVVDGNIKFLDGRFNHLGFDGSVVPEGCIIYHFFGREKPWNIALTAYDKMWRKYLETSFWEDIKNDLPVKKAENYHNFKQAGMYYKKHGNVIKSLTCYYWYAVLKLKLKLKL